MNEEGRRNKVFVSHSSADEAYVKAVVELLEDIGIGQEEIICTSVNNYKIPLGRSIYDYLAEQFQNYNLYVLFLLSKNYYASVACLNEMGAAWVLKHRYCAILLPGMQYEEVKGCIDRNQIGLKLDGEEEDLKYRLYEFQKDMTKEFLKPDMNAGKWERKREEFLDKVKKHMVEEQAENDVPANQEYKEPLSLEAAILLAYATESRGEVFIMRDLGGTHVQAGIWDFTGNNSSARTVAQWEAAVEELLYMNLIKRVGVRDRMYGVTCRGFEVADAVKEKLEFEKSKTPDVYLELKKNWQRRW